jgi:stage III sporulation protein AG
MNDLLKKYLEKLKNPRTLIIIGVIGIVLIFLSSFIEPTPDVTKGAEDFSAEEYKESLEKDVTKLVKSISGSRKVTVVITLESGMNYQYADNLEETDETKNDNQNTAEKSELKQNYITVKNADGSEAAILISKQMPEIRGVAIVCEGGDNAALNQKIQNAVMSALNITSKRVYIAGGN